MHRKHTRLAACLAILLLPVAGLAQGLEYSYLQFAYVSEDYDDREVDADGVAVSGSALLADRFYATVAVSQVETDKYTNLSSEKGAEERGSLALGLGFRQPLAKNTDLTLEAAFLRGKEKGQGDFTLDETDNGYSASIGVRHLVSQQFELGADISHQDIFADSQTSFGVNALVHLSAHFSAGLGYTLHNDADRWQAGMRINF